MSEVLAQRRASDRISRWVGFDLAGQAYALPILRVREVLPAPVVEPVPGAPAEILGLINLRGRILTVIDLRQRLGLAPARGERYAVMVIDGGGEWLGLRVDAVCELRSVVAQAVQEAPRVPPPAGFRLCGVVLRDGQWLHLLDLEGLPS